MRKQAAILALGAMIAVGTVVPEQAVAQTQERVCAGCHDRGGDGGAGAGGRADAGARLRWVP